MRWSWNIGQAGGWRAQKRLDWPGMATVRASASAPGALPRSAAKAGSRCRCKRAEPRRRSDRWIAFLSVATVLALGSMALSSASSKFGQTGATARLHNLSGHHGPASAQRGNMRCVTNCTSCRGRWSRTPRQGCRVVLWLQAPDSAVPSPGPTACNWTKDREDWQSADAVVFEATYFDLADFPDPVLKPERQLWALAGFEQPRLRAFPKALDALADYVDLWGTPDERSDIRSGHLLPTAASWREGDKWRQNVRNVDSGESLFLFAAISNCNAVHTSRLDIVKQVVSRVRDVEPQLANKSEVRGACFQGFMDTGWFRHRRSLLQDTMFALAFENSFFPNYATEKLIDALETGAIPVVQGGARYSDLVPRDPVDVLGQHPVFIDALSFDRPSELADYLVWLHRTGKSSNYRPWLRLPNGTGTAADEGKNPTDPPGWPCVHNDVVRCGMAGMRLALDPTTCGATLVSAVHRQLGREPDPRRVCQHRIRGSGDAGIARQTGVSESLVARAWAPWRLPGADPTMDEYRSLHGLPPGRLGPNDLVLDLDRCRGCRAGQVCVATQATQARLLSTHAEYWSTWVKSYKAGTCK